MQTGHRRTMVFYKLNPRPSQPRLFDEDLETRLRRAFDPNRRVDRGMRQWRLAAPVWRDDGVVMGKFGYVRLSAGARVEYDEERHDFVRSYEEDEQVGFVHFVVVIRERLLAFEARSPSLSAPILLNAFRQLFRESDLPYQLEAVLDQRSFQAWRTRMDRVVDISVRANFPNPRSRRPKNLIAVLSSARAEQMAISAFTSDPGGLNLESELLEEAVGHVTSGYGSLTAEGVSEGRTSRFNSKTAAVVVIVDVPPDEEPDDVYDQLIREAEKLET